MIDANEAALEKHLQEQEKAEAKYNAFEIACVELELADRYNDIVNEFDALVEEYGYDSNVVELSDIL